MFYHAKFGRSTSKGVGISREEPKNWVRWGLAPCDGGMSDPLKHPHVLSRRN